jgi:hypothetical protein
VSRLYNALEKIRTGQQVDFSEKKSAPDTGIGPSANKSRKRRLALLGASAVLVLALVVFFSLPRRKDAAPVISNPGAVSVIAPARTQDHPAEPVPQDKSPKPAPTVLAPLAAPPLAIGSGSELYSQLNDMGVAHVQANQHWRGIYFLEQARRQQPERPEALINMAVALAELGLRGPAKKLFSEAHALAPNHPLLRKNLEILGQADFFDPQWLSSLSAGLIQPGQETQPQ